MLMNYKMIAATSAVILLLSVGATPASATPLWSADFESDTAGAAPATAAATAGVTNTSPTSIVAPALVQDGYTDSDPFGALASLSSNVLVLDAGRAFFNGNNADAITSGVYNIEFDLIRDTQDSGGNSFLTVRNTLGGTIATLLFQPQFGRVRITQTGAQTNTVNSTVSGVNYGNALAVRFSIDFGAATQEAFVDGVSVLSGTFDASSTLARFDFNAGGSNIMAIDNITVIPEPTSIALVGLGLIGMVGLGRRRRM